MKQVRRTLWILCFSCIVATAAAAQEAHLMRWADIYGDTVVFTYEDDLWLVPANGGDARRITNHPGSERYAKFSPDGKTLASASADQFSVCSSRAWRSRRS